MEVVQRRIGIITASAYRTVPKEAIAVVAAIPPLRLKAKERSEIYENGDKENARKEMVNKWQEEWNNANKGRWTYRLIPRIEGWINRRQARWVST